MAEKDLRISLSVELAGVKEVEDKLRELQRRLNSINNTYFSKMFNAKDMKIDIPVNLTNISAVQKQIQGLSAAAQKTAQQTVEQSAAQNVVKATTSTQDTPQAGVGFDWRTAIQVTKMKQLNPAALMQMASRMMTLTAAVSGFIGVLGGVGARVAFNTITKYTRTVTSALGELKTVVLSLTGMDKMLSVSGITNSMIAMADATKEIQKQALQTGIAVDALSQYRFAMKQVGVSAENFGSNIAYMGKAIVQAATGASIDAGNAFKKLKLDPKQLRLKDTQTQFEEIAKAISQLPSESDKASAALLIFNRSGSQLLPFINKFNEGIRQSESILGRLPQIMRQYAAEFTQFSNNISNLQIKGQQFITGFMTQIVPALNGYLQDALKIDFTDFGKMFADNFQRTVTSLTIKDDLGGLLNSFTLDLMDVVDKTLQKTIDYVGEALIKIDWSAITAKVLEGTWNFVIKSASKAGEVIVQKAGATPSGENFSNYEQRVATTGEIGEFFLDLKKRGIEEKEARQILEDIFNKNNFEAVESRDLFGRRTGNYERGAGVFSREENARLQAILINNRENLNNIDTLSEEYAQIVGKEQAKVFKENILKEILEERTEAFKVQKEKDISADSNLMFDTPESKVWALNDAVEEFRKQEQENIKRELASSFELQQKVIFELKTALEKSRGNEQQKIGEASASVTQAANGLKKAFEHYKQLELDSARIHSEAQKTNTLSPEEKLQESKEYADKRLNVALAKEISLNEAKKILDRTKEIVGQEEEWVNLNKQVEEGLKDVRNEIKQLKVDQKLTDEEFLLKKFSIEAEVAERNVKSLKNALASLKSDKSLTADNIKAIGGGYKSYIDSLYSKRDVLESQQAAYTASGFNKDLIDKTAREIADLNNTIQQAINERNDWAQSAIVEATSAQVAQRNVELGQYEFKQLPQWAATDTQRYQYQMDVYDAQIAAAEENIEAIRKAKDEMLMLDPAVQKVKEAMQNLSPEVENYDEKFAGLMNDLEDAKRNSIVRRSARYRQLEQMEGQEGIKRVTAKSGKFNAQNPEGFGHQLAGGIKNASDQMGTLQQNVGQGFGNMIMSVRDSLSTLIGDLLNGTMTIGQAFQKMGQTILQSLISTFGQIVANFIMQQTVMRLLQMMFNAELAAQAAELTTMWTGPATLASIASWGGAAVAGSSAVISALALTKSATAGMSAMAKGGRVKGKEQIIRVNEEGEEFVVSARSPMSNEPYLKLANMGYNLDSLFADQSAREISNSAGRLNIINNNKAEAPQPNNNINIGMINSRQDKRRWMRKEGQRMIVDFLNSHRGALKYA